MACGPWQRCQDWASLHGRWEKRNWRRLGHSTGWEKVQTGLLFTALLGKLQALSGNLHTCRHSRRPPAALLRDTDRPGIDAKVFYTIHEALIYYNETLHRRNMFHGPIWLSLLYKERRRLGVPIPACTSLSLKHFLFQELLTSSCFRLCASTPAIGCLHQRSGGLVGRTTPSKETEGGRRRGEAPSWHLSNRWAMPSRAGSRSQWSFYGGITRFQAREQRNK